MLRCRQPRRGGLGRQGLCRHARWAPDRAQCARPEKPIWTVRPVEKPASYTITGAPTIIKGLVLIGNGGSEYDARGYVTAYDAETGKQVWRFYMVPGDPSKGFENKAMEMAAKTWNGEWWKLGGGGSPWNAIVYDPADGSCLYRHRQWRAVEPRGSAAPTAATICSSLRSSRSSPKPANMSGTIRKCRRDEWDFDSTQPIMTRGSCDQRCDAPCGHASAEGRLFLYARCCETDELISAKPYRAENWSTGIDMTTGGRSRRRRARSGTRQEFVGEPEPNGGA